jgi:hypothetical protein
LDANGEWVVSDEKHFTIDVVNTVTLVVKGGETLQYGDSEKTATWRIGLCTGGGCELERGVHRLYVTIEEWEGLYLAGGGYTGMRLLSEMQAETTL